MPWLLEIIAEAEVIPGDPASEIIPEDPTVDSDADQGEEEE